MTRWCWATKEHRLSEWKDLFFGAIEETRGPEDRRDSSRVRHWGHTGARANVHTRRPCTLRLWPAQPTRALPHVHTPSPSPPAHPSSSEASASVHTWVKTAPWWASEPPQDLRAWPPELVSASPKISWDPGGRLLWEQTSISVGQGVLGLGKKIKQRLCCRPGSPGGRPQGGREQTGSLLGSALGINTCRLGWGRGGLGFGAVT